MTSEEAINLLDNLIGMVEDNQQNDYDEAFKLAIKSLKSWDEDVAPVVHGEWISWYVEVKHGNCEEYIPHTACCACETEIDPYHKDAYKWCPFCGAKMDGEV